MSRLSEITLGELAEGLRRYRPFIALLIAILLVALFLPGRVSTPGNTATLSAPGAGTGPAVNAPGQPGAAAGAAVAGGGAAPPAGTAPGTAGGSTGGAQVGAAGGAAPVGPPAGTVTGRGAVDPNCDTSRGRIRFPSLYAPPCVPLFRGANGAGTYQGVSANSITIGVYLPQTDPATKAVLEAEGDNDSDTEIENDYLKYAQLLEHHFQTYGRRIVLKFVQASGNATDETAGRADAVTIAKQDKAFMAWTYVTPVDSFTNELTRDHVICMCTVTLPASFYLQHAPYVWGTGLPDENQAYLMRSEVIAKDIAGRKAQFAGDPALQLKTRTFGLIWYNTPQNAYAAGEKFFVQQLARRGVRLTDAASYEFNPQTAQNDSDTIISKFKSEGITSVIFVGDPIYPSFYTGAATRQNYHPEWIVTGSALTDETAFARVYDQTQWRHAFGLGLLAVRTQHKSDLEPFRVYQWGYGGQPPGPGTAGALYPLILTSFIGVQEAGPQLDPSTFQRGLFSYPESPTHPTITATRAGWGTRLWGYPDYNFSDDGTLLYWDPSAQGPDENGNNGVGMYRYLFGGTRYLAGQFPTNVPWFNPAGTVTVLPSLPSTDTPPSYPNRCQYLC